MLYWASFSSERHRFSFRKNDSLSHYWLAALLLATSTTCLSSLNLCPLYLKTESGNKKGRIKKSPMISIHISKYANNALVFKSELLKNWMSMHLWLQRTTLIHLSWIRVFSNKYFCLSKCGWQVKINSIFRLKICYL